MDLREKTVIITGASEGIGRVTALAFAAAGSRVVLGARSREKLDAAVREIEGRGGTALGVCADVADTGQAVDLVERAAAAFGRVDVLVNNAGYGLMGAMADLPLEDVQAVFDVNVFGVLRCVRAAVPHMRRQGGGQIVNVSSVVGRVTIPYMGAYCATKYALNSISEALRAELRHENINVITVMPGRIDTSFGKNAVRRAGMRMAGNYKGAPAETVARAIVTAVRRERGAIVVPWWNRFFQIGRNLAPDLVDGIIERATRRAQTGTALEN